MAAKKTEGETAAPVKRTLLQRAATIMRVLDPLSQDERRRVMAAVDALATEGKAQLGLPGTV